MRYFFALLLTRYANRRQKSASEAKKNRFRKYRTVLYRHDLYFLNRFFKAAASYFVFYLRSGLVALFLTACTSSGSSKSLKIAFHVFPSTVDPRKASDFVSSTLICLIYEGLTRSLPNGSIELALAERVDISEDGTVYTFHLREAQWTDGSPITAYDFESSWQKIVDPSFPSPCSYLFYPIKNAENIAKKKAFPSELGVRALGEHLLEVELERPCPYFLSLTSLPSFLPIPKHLSEKDLDQMERPTTCGPFTMERSELQASLFLSRNKAFWNAENIRLEAIEIQVISDEMTALHLFAEKKLDWIGGALSPLPIEAAPFLKKGQGLRFFPMAATTFCSFNVNRPLLKNRLFRQALSMAIPRDEIVEHVTQLGETIATRYVPPALFGGDDKTLYPFFDPEKAKTLLREALREENRETCPPLTLIFRSNLTDKKIAQILQGYWKDVLEIEVSLRELDFKTHKERLHQKNYDLSLMYWIAQIHDPINILERFKDPQNLKNYPGWSQKNYADCLEKALEERDAAARMHLLEEAEKLIADEMPIAPIYHWTSAGLCQPKLKNLEATPNGGLLFERAFLEPED